MRKLFFIGIIGLIIFELANIYFIMPFPGSQRMNSISLAYFLHSWRWIFRIIFAIMIIAGLLSAFRGRKIAARIAAVFLLLVAGVVVYAANFIMSADHMFRQAKTLIFKSAAENKVDTSRLILGIIHNGQAKAYPIQFLGYHHQVFDSIGGKPVIVTYCTVCRSGRVFEPVVRGKIEKFRLVGMDHFNAMFENQSTKSWWRQATGEAIAGKNKNEHLPEFPSVQMELGQWLALYPASLVMQPDPEFESKYQKMNNYESGKSTSHLTKQDSTAWKDKSWVVGIIVNGKSKAYDWFELEKKRIIHDSLGNTPVVIVLANDKKTFAAFLRNDFNQQFRLNNGNELIDDRNNKYSLVGKSLNAGVPDLVKVNAYQEYWHSWRMFHPGTRSH